MDHTPTTVEGRLERLRELFKDAGSALVTFSGGVDSALVARVGHEVLGEKAVALTADSPTFPKEEREQAEVFCRSIGMRHEVVDAHELERDGYRANAGDRCYFCKAALFRAMESFARSERFPCLAFGEIVDDWSDDRPGARAAKEFGVVAPLSAAGFGKDDVRRYAALHGLPVADKPASACLASRIPVGTEVTPERLARVETAEAGLKALGFRVLRVRHHGAHARVEVGADEAVRAREERSRIEAVLAESGFESHELAVYGQL